MAILSHLLSSSKVVVKPENETKTKRATIGLLCFGSNNKEEDHKKNREYDKNVCYAKARMHNELFRSSSMDLNNVSHCCYGPVDVGDPMRLQAIIVGPSATPFAGGIFFLTVQIPPDYPFKPPKIKFRTKVFHPNVGRDGTIHIDILSYNWTPALTIDKLLLSICSFLPDPNHEHDYCSSVCNLYWNHRNLYNKIAREWTRKYAMI